MEKSDRDFSKKRQAEYRRKAYLEAKAKRDADPKYQALKEKARQQRREMAKKMREQKKKDVMAAKAKRQKDLMDSLLTATELAKKIKEG